MKVLGLRLALVLVCIATGVVEAHAQERSAPVVPTDSVTAAETAALLNYQNELVQRIELSQERRSRWLLGGVVGFVAGAGVTALVLHSGGSTSLCDRSANQDAMSSGECLGLTVAGGVVGAAVGAWIGSRVRTQ